ncbi:MULTISPECIES: hypothetical protein [Dickeya]|uniref:Uncharacterized protein n=1 Tax=Dickeya aquatica TaxID=1401087 RepID=A0A375ADL9_9GAMM|nr:MULTISPECIES: hypothetical protein [Dickeya]SLM63991.1 hypothetical protein DAQ1742_03168 [Dickeya aquatica]SLM64511.1 hypothetical protein DAQ1742_03717 [Dickeya aquatica]
MPIVNNCQYWDNGAYRVYSLSDGSRVNERPVLPGKSRWEYFDARGSRIYKSAVQREMKRAVEKHKKLWRVS